MITTLIFVYNANAGTFNSLIDSAHKILSPQTYTCALCELTHGILKERVEWVRFRESVQTTNPQLQLIFLHKDAFEKQYWSKWLPKYTYPIILSKNERLQDYNDGFGTNSGLDIFMNTPVINNLETTQQLINAIKQQLQKS